MTLNVLLFADDPELAAELLFSIEEAGPFQARPIDGNEAACIDDFSTGDVAVIVPGNDAEKTEALLMRLDEQDVPAILLGSIAASGEKPLRAERRDRETLVSRLQSLQRESAAPDSAAARGGPVPGSRHVVNKR